MQVDNGDVVCVNPSTPSSSDWINVCDATALQLRSSRLNSDYGDANRSISDLEAKLSGSVSEINQISVR